MATPKTGNPNGRPRIQFDLEGIESLAALNCTQLEVAQFFGISLATVEHRFNQEPELRAAWDRGRATGKLSLRRKQSQLAEEGNVTMLIWLGKQLLGQSDRQSIEHTGANGGPIQLTQIRTEVAAAVAELTPELRNAVGARLLNADGSEE